MQLYGICDSDTLTLILRSSHRNKKMAFAGVLAEADIKAAIAGCAGETSSSQLIAK